MTNTRTVSNTSTTITKLHFPQAWLDSREPLSLIEQMEVRKVPNSSDDELFFGALPDGDNNYAHEVDENMPEPRYSQNAFAVSFSTAAMRVRVASRKEWESGSRIATKPRYVFSLGPNDSSGEIEYKHRRYSKVGKYWGKGMLSPTGKWLAIFSYTGEKPPPDFFHFLGGGSPRTGDIFWQVYDTVTGKKVFEWEARNVKSPTTLDTPVVWLEDHYFLFPEDQQAQNFTVVTLPALTPEVNPVTVQLPSRRDATGHPLPAAARNEVWAPLVALTKEQAAKLTAPYDTEIPEVRLLAQPTHWELLLAIREETENRRINRQQRDGGGEYNFRVLSTYYYAVSIDDPTQTRLASKEEWDRGKVLRSDRAKISEATVSETIPGTLPPYRQFPKSGTSWSSPQVLSAGEWIAVFSYSPEAREHPAGKMFVDLYDQRSGYKLLSTALPYSVSPNELFKGALWIEGGYMLLPLNSSLDSFALWQLP